MRGGTNFLWVGRLNENKDPLTVLSGFEKYFKQNPDARLFMIYSEDDLLEPVRQRINSSPVLNDKVKLVGKIVHEQLPDWYSAADYFVSGSRREGGGYALKEAMACGCIPVVTDIPAFMKTIDNGRVGYYFKAGDSDSLFGVLTGLDQGMQSAMSMKVIGQFRNNLSPAVIAEKMLSVYKALRM
jgi:glycosyltransferase involved in cell wall biosynthesis